MRTDERIARRRHEGGDAREELERGQHHVLGLARVRALHTVGDAAVAQPAQARQGDGGAERVAAKALASEIVAHADAGVEVESGVVHRAMG